MQMLLTNFSTYWYIFFYIKEIKNRRNILDHLIKNQKKKNKEKLAAFQIPLELG